MSPRRNRPAARPQPSQRVYGTESIDTWQGEEWVVRRIAGAAAAKHYRCPGCDQEIPPGVPHVVAWPQLGAVDDRRHWHAPCWTARDRRTARQASRRRSTR
ncbi:ATP/GTP-binding protein [Streptomyces hainanensis]|uniref:ATP/GTP-binding protein n=1 Tax=Streptomyces hainanensis TaxID=402648 RepID=A0A4R4TAH6_9ACTN|nr:ATP/GTP-binding protein [Streptomyces hainanensis]TDC72484.1 ATP/GTP-binding protein [Streptomyces hainanensis]